MPFNFKGDKPKKRKRAAEPDADGDKRSRSSKPEAVDKQDSNIQISVNPAEAGEDDSWAPVDAEDEVKGPMILVLPTTPPTCLAADMTGKVYASLLVNVDPTAPGASAEPHDPRQIFVSVRVAGNPALHLRSGGQMGPYLSAARDGSLTAAAESLSPLESFTLVPVPDTTGAFALRTERGKFITVKAPGTIVREGDIERSVVRADAKTVEDAAALRLRMQAKNKPRAAVKREETAYARISRRELQEAAGRTLTEDEVRTLKRARREGNYHEALLDIKVKSKHDKFA